MSFTWIDNQGLFDEEWRGWTLRIMEDNEGYWIKKGGREKWSRGWKGREYKNHIKYGSYCVC